VTPARLPVTQFTNRTLFVPTVDMPTLGWLKILSVTGANDPVAARLREEQMTEVMRAFPLLAVMLTLHAIALMLQVLHTALAQTAMLWFAAHTLILAWASYAARRNRRVAAGPIRSASRIRRVAFGAAILAAIWNGMIGAAMIHAAPQQAIALAAIQIALIGAGAFALASAPLAALIYLAIFVAAHGILASIAVIHGVESGYVLVLISAMGLTIARGIFAHASSLARQVAGREALRDRSEMIELLLSEYENNGVDWLWETDAECRVTYISPKFAELSGYALDSSIAHARRVSSWGAATGDNREFHDALATRARFRNLYLHTVANGVDRWWCLSASPRLDSEGRFAGFTGVGSDVTEQRRAREQIERLATSDSLTGLANRERMRGHIEAALDAVRAGGSGACAVMLIDLDRFKDVNDTLGHHIGDELLREVAARLNVELKHGGVCARLGGDEFAVVLSGVNAAAARSVAARIIDALSVPYWLRDSEIRVGASIGVAMGLDDGNTVSEVMRAADLALYRAKADGRGVVRLYEPTLHTDAEARRALETALRGALVADELSLMFQPIVDLLGGEVVGFEALLRWKNARLGQVSPIVFIPVAEELGLMDSIGEWVLRQACVRAAEWPSDIGISVNLSPSQLINPRLPGIVLHALATNGIAPERLELEVTENIFLNEADDMRGALDQLARLGVRIGLDDFGTGYSSLGYLRTKVFDTLKINHCFVRESVDADSQSAAIVRHIVGLAASLGMETVAEGAETIEELNAVRALGCGRVQGYYTGRPMVPEAALAMVSPTMLEARAA